MQRPVRFTTEERYLIKIFESNLGNDQPQRGFDEMMREIHSKGPNMSTDPFKLKNQQKQTQNVFLCCKTSSHRTEVFPGCLELVIRSYEGESTASHPNCEVKHLSAQSVLQWGTMWES